MIFVLLLVHVCVHRNGKWKSFFCWNADRKNICVNASMTFVLCTFHLQCRESFNHIFCTQYNKWKPICMLAWCTQILQMHYRNHWLSICMCICRREIIDSIFVCRNFSWWRKRFSFVVQYVLHRGCMTERKITAKCKSKMYWRIRVKCWTICVWCSGWLL